MKVYFLDRSGDVITTLVDWICPRGSQTFFLPVVHDLPGNWVGWVRVESQDWWTPGTKPVTPPDIVGVVTLLKYNDAARTNTVEGMAYNMLPEHKAFDWQVGFGGGGLDSGIGTIAIPSLLKDLDGQGVTSEIAIMNLVAKPGFTDFAIYIYDQNGLLDFVCQKLHDRQVEYIDLATWGYVNEGFKGSAVIRATFWEHEVWDDTGFFLRNLVGLGAVSVERTGTRLGEDVPGDEAAASRGIPSMRQWVTMTVTGSTVAHTATSKRTCRRSTAPVWARRATWSRPACARRSTAGARVAARVDRGDSQDPGMEGGPPHGHPCGHDRDRRQGEERGEDRDGA